MKNREERPTASDRGASQRTFDFGDEAESMLPANLLRQELTDPASIDTPSLSVSSETDLMEQVVDPRNLDRAWRQVKSNRGAPGPDGMTIKAFESWCPEHWPAVKQQLLDGTYRPSPVRRKTIPKEGGGERLLGIPNVLDRLIQQAICQVLTPIFDPEFSESSFGFRPGRSAHGAAQRVQQIIRQRREFCVDLDLSKFFD
jgi:RNA-directed DNA polymerase